MSTAPAPLLAASPCIGICRMDDATGWCVGCLRTLDEIAAWAQWGDADKRGVWLALSARRLQWRRLHKGDANVAAGSAAAAAPGGSAKGAA